MGAEIPVSVQGSRPVPAVGGVEQAPVPFVEQTKTVIVFANGAVVRLSEGVFPGQILIVKNLKTDREAACRVISSKSIGNVQGYVEVEFTHSTSGFWEGNGAAPAQGVTEAQIVEASREASRDFAQASDKNQSSERASEDDAMSKALADAFSSLMSPATRTPTPDSAAKPSAIPASSTSEVMRSPGLNTKVPNISSSPSNTSARSSVLANAKPVAIGDLIGAPPSNTFAEAEPAEAGYKPPSAYRGIEPRKSSVQPDLPARAAARQVEQPQVSRVTAKPKSGGQWVWMLAGVAASAVLMVGGFFGYWWYVGGGAPFSASSAAASSSTSPASSPASSPAAAATSPASGSASKPASANPNPVSSASFEPERVVVKAPPEPQLISSKSPSREGSSSSSSNANTNSAAPKGEAQPPAAPARQSSVLSMKNKMAAPKAPGNGARQASALNSALPDIANAGSSNSVGALPSNALGGTLAAPPGGVASNSSIVQPKLISTVAPVYPQNATLNGVEGDVRIDAVISENGHVGAMKIIEGPMPLRQSAMAAVSQWRYEPAKLDGKAISSHLVVLVHFRLKK
ncbi:MAG TPA: TonB family protein [Candidatus Acidoferrales bacterium]|nr:TonB family protein [Candidatus Acidoferrales bacterium]